MKEIVIPKEKAVFWLDKNGCWNNKHGKFELKKIIDHFHSSIKKDEAGYHVSQVNGDCLEKVYFPYEDTALFVFDVIREGDDISLVLNTKKIIGLDPERLSVKDDALYMYDENELVKFTERSFMKISDIIETEGERYFIRIGDTRYGI